MKAATSRKGAKAPMEEVAQAFETAVVAAGKLGFSHHQAPLPLGPGPGGGDAVLDPSKQVLQVLGSIGCRQLLGIKVQHHCTPKGTWQLPNQRLDDLWEALGPHAHGRDV